MKVNNSNVSNSLHKVNQQKSDRMEDLGKSNDSSVNRNPEMDGSAKVNLSDRAQAMSTAKEIAGDQSVDESKVARLQKLIDEGKYKTDASAIADKLVDEHLLMPE